MNLQHELEADGKLIQFIFRGGEIVAEKTDDNIICLIRGSNLLASDAENARTYYHYASNELGSITHVADDSEVLNRYELMYGETLRSVRKPYLTASCSQGSSMIHLPSSIT